MSAIENPLSLLSFDSPSSVTPHPIVPSYATANRIPVPLVNGIASSFKSPNIDISHTRSSIRSSGVTPPPSYGEFRMYSPNNKLSVHTKGVSSIPNLNTQPIPDLKPFLSGSINWKKIVFVLFIVFMVLFIIYIIMLLCKDSKRCHKATSSGLSRSKDKSKLYEGAAPVTKSIEHVQQHGYTMRNDSKGSGGFSRLLRPGPQGSLDPLVDRRIRRVTEADPHAKLGSLDSPRKRVETSSRSEDMFRGVGPLVSSDPEVDRRTRRYTEAQPTLSSIAEILDTETSDDVNQTSNSDRESNESSSTLSPSI
jgi:hypothetical protein